MINGWKLSYMGNTRRRRRTKSRKTREQDRSDTSEIDTVNVRIDTADVRIDTADVRIDAEQMCELTQQKTHRKCLVQTQRKRRTRP